MALLLDVTLVADLDQVLADVFACFIKRALQNVVCEGEADKSSKRLNDGDDVEDDDGSFH